MLVIKERAPKTSTGDTISRFAEPREGQLTEMAKKQGALALERLPQVEIVKPFGANLKVRVPDNIPDSMSRRLATWSRNGDT